MKTKIKPSKEQLKKRTELFNYIVRYWFHHLTALERLAVIFIYDRTWGWNKEWEEITVNQFTQGLVRCNEGTWVSYAAPFSKDRTGAQKVIKRLVDKGVIFRRPVPNDSRGMIEYSLNIDWVIPDIRFQNRQSR